MTVRQDEIASSKKTINQNEFRIVGMARSGNHAIINWIINQIDGNYCFLNCAEPKTNPFCSARPLHDGMTYQVNYPDFDLPEEQRGNFTRKNYLLHSYEDCFLGMLTKKLFENQHDTFVGSSRNRVDILILRDPFNLFASRKKSRLLEKHQALGCKTVTSLTAARIWKQHAREALGVKKYFKREKVVILYNSWVRDETYRQRIATQLGLTFTDAGIQNVSGCAGGSSFDGLQFDKAATKMNVLDRWKHFTKDSDYFQLFDEEMIELSNRLFGRLPVEALMPASL